MFETVSIADFHKLKSNVYSIVGATAVGTRLPAKEEKP